MLIPRILLAGLLGTLPGGAPPEPDAGAPPCRTAPMTPVDALLVDLERNAEALEAFTASIAYTKHEALLERESRRIGRLVYEVEPESGRKRFAIIFERRIDGRRVEDRRKDYVFDGSWLAEIDHHRKQFIRHQIVPPGETFDPLKLGEGPFPLPIGQPREAVLARFDVELAEVPDRPPLDRLDPAEVRGLSLVPKPGSPAAEDFSRVRVYYDRTTLLPVGILADEVNGDAKIITLGDPKRNPELTESQRAALDVTEPPGEGWSKETRPWRGAPAGG